MCHNNVLNVPRFDLLANIIVSKETSLVLSSNWGTLSGKCRCVNASLWKYSLCPSGNSILWYSLVWLIETYEQLSFLSPTLFCLAKYSFTSVSMCKHKACHLVHRPWMSTLGDRFQALFVWSFHLLICPHMLHPNQDARHMMLTLYVV